MVKTLNWTHVTFSLQELLKSEQLPFLVKTADNYCLTSGTVFKFVQEVELQYLQVRVLSWSDVDKKCEKEFHLEHSKYVGKELLIPTGYKGKIKTERRKYINIKEVIDDFPEFIVADEDIATSEASCRSLALIPCGTCLKLNRTKREGANKHYLLCVDKGVEYALSEDKIARFSSGSENVFTFSDFAQKSDSWQTFSFLKMDGVSFATLEKDVTEDMLKILMCPLKPLSVVRKAVVVGVGRNSTEEKLYHILMPKDDNIQEKIEVKIPLYDDIEGLSSAIKDFPEKVHLPLLEQELYALDTNKPMFVLRCRLPTEDEKMSGADDVDAAQKRSSRGTPPPLPPRSSDTVLTCRRPSLKDTQTVEKEATAPACTLPDSQVQLPTRLPEKEEGIKYYLKTVAKRSKAGFDKVHTQLLQFFKSKNFNHDSEYAEISCSTQSSDSNSDEEYMTPLPRRMKPPVPPSYVEDPLNDTYRELPPRTLKNESNNTSRKTSTQIRPLYGRTLSLPDTSDKRNVCVEQNLSKQFCQSNFNIQDVTGINDMHAHLLSREEVDVASEFLSYTVEEVTKCFLDCAMIRVAEFCKAELLDGKFFKSFDVTAWQNKPLYLSSFEIVKIRKIVNGWRPTVN